MRTQRQIEASRINGAKSRGPVTDAGKQKSSRNSRRHCLYAKNIEDDIQVSSPVSDPQSPAPLSAASELDLLEQAALNAYRDRMRIIYLETRIMNEEIARQRLIHPAESEITLHSLAFCRLADETGTIHALYRCEGVAMRRWERALERINRWQRWHRLKPVVYPEVMLREPEIEKNKIYETNLTHPLYGGLSLTNKGTPAAKIPIRKNEPKQAYNLRVANHDNASRTCRFHPDRIHRPRGPRAGPNNQAAHARPHPPVLKRHPSDRQSRRAFG